MPPTGLRNDNAINVSVTVCVCNSTCEAQTFNPALSQSTLRKCERNRLNAPDVRAILVDVFFRTE